MAWDGAPRVYREATLKARKATLVLEDGTTAAWPPSKKRAAHRDTTAAPSITGAETIGESAYLCADSKPTSHARKDLGIFAPALSLALEKQFWSRRSDRSGVARRLDAAAGRACLSPYPCWRISSTSLSSPAPIRPSAVCFGTSSTGCCADTRASRTPEAQSLSNSMPVRTKHADYRETAASKQIETCGLSRSFFASKGSKRHEEFWDPRCEDLRLRERAMKGAGRNSSVSDRRGRPGSARAIRNIPVKGHSTSATTSTISMSSGSIQDQIQRSQLRQGAVTRNACCILDLPLGFIVDSYDTWRYPESFRKRHQRWSAAGSGLHTGPGLGIPPMHPAGDENESLQVHNRLYPQPSADLRPCSGSTT